MNRISTTLLGAVLTAWLLLCGAAHAQQNVFSRSDANTDLWWDDSAKPWFYQFDGNQNRPDNFTRNNVFIGHNNNTTMNVNGAFFQLRSLTLQTGSSANRTFNATSGGGISLSDGLYIEAGSGAHTFNVQFGVDGSTVNFTNNGGTASFTSNIFLNSNTAAFSGSSSIGVSGVIGGGSSTGGGITKSGAGTLTLSGNNTYTGATTINASGGIVDLSNSGSSTSGRISGTSGVTVNGSGTLRFSGSNTYNDRINNSAGVTLAGGTLSLNGIAEGSGASGGNGVGALTLTSTSTINFASGLTNSLIHFGSIGAHTTGAILQLTNWDGNLNGGGQERLLFSGATSSFSSVYMQNEVSFNGTAGYKLIDFGGTYFEVVPVPEPSTYAAGFLAFAALGFSQRRRLARGLKRAGPSARQKRPRQKGKPADFISLRRPFGSTADLPDRRGRRPLNSHREESASRANAACTAPSPFPVCSLRPPHISPSPFPGQSSAVSSPPSLLGLSVVAAALVRAERQRRYIIVTKEM